MFRMLDLADGILEGETCSILENWTEWYSIVVELTGVLDVEVSEWQVFWKSD